MKKTWTMVAPPEPDAKIVRVYDKDNAPWNRCEHGWSYEETPVQRPWGEVVERYGPLTAEVPDPIVVTDEMLAEGWGSGWDFGVVRQNVTAALRAGGYEVAE